jgi:AraC family transcriptional regulator, transcriptional activator of pobA
MEKIPIRHITTAQTGAAFSESFSIRNIHDLLAGKDMVQELHRHDFYYILALQKGAGSHEIDFRSYKIGDKTIFFMRPGQVHQLVLKAGSTGYLMQFKNEGYPAHDKGSVRLLRKAGNINNYQFTTKGFQKLLDILTCIIQEYTGKQESYQHAIKANMDIFFIELARHELARQNSITPSNKDNPDYRNPDNANLYMQEQLEKFIELVEKDIYSQKQVSQYAAKLNLSTYQLNAITKTILGKTCSELINEYLVLEAKRYLLATSDQINQIANHLGYEDPSYFIRFFKKHTRHSPETFRNNYR